MAETSVDAVTRVPIAKGSTKRALAGPSNIDQSALELNFDITIVGGAAGRRLATEQVDAILEVVEWFTRRPPRST